MEYWRVGEYSSPLNLILTLILTCLQDMNFLLTTPHCAKQEINIGSKVQGSGFRVKLTEHWSTGVLEQWLKVTYFH